MFERFTDRARRVVVLGQEEARFLNHNFIGTEHLVLGLISESEGLAAQTLESLDVDLHAARTRVEEIIGRGNGSPVGHMPFTPRAKKVLEMSLREAIQLGHSSIGTKHLLLGLLREGQGVGAQVLVQMGADLKRTRQQILGIVGSGASEEIEDDPADVGATGNLDLIIESLAGEVRRLRREADRLRAELRRAEPGPASFRPASLPGTDVPPAASPEAAGPPAVIPEAAPPGSGEPLAEPGAYRSVLRCSFCGEPQDRVTKLIAGPGVYICDRCIALCQEILDEELAPPEIESPNDDRA